MVGIRRSAKTMLLHMDGEHQQDEADRDPDGPETDGKTHTLGHGHHS
jgi:hypothetical protein